MQVFLNCLYIFYEIYCRLGSSDSASLPKVCLPKWLDPILFITCSPSPASSPPSPPTPILVLCPPAARRFSDHVLGSFPHVCRASLPTQREVILPDPRSPHSVCFLVVLLFQGLSRRPHSLPAPHSVILEHPSVLHMVDSLRHLHVPPASVTAPVRRLESKLPSLSVCPLPSHRLPGIFLPAPPQLRAPLPLFLFIPLRPPCSKWFILYHSKPKV